MTVHVVGPDGTNLWVVTDDAVKVVAVEDERYSFVLAEGVTPPDAFELAGDMAFIDKSAVARVVLTP